MTQPQKTYIYDMFVRKKKNRSGTTSVVVVDKHGGKFKELHTVGIANSDEEIEKLLIQGKAWIKLLSWCSKAGL